MIAMPTAVRSVHPSTTFDANEFEMMVQQSQSVHIQNGTALDSALSEGIEFELVKTGYPMHNVRCHCDESSVRLTGHVRLYFYLQIAIEITRRLASGRRIANEIEVVACPTENCGDVDGDI